MFLCMMYFIVARDAADKMQQTVAQLVLPHGGYGFKITLGVACTEYTSKRVWLVSTNLFPTVDGLATS